MSTSFLLRDGIVATPEHWYAADIRIRSGVVEEIGVALRGESGITEIDCSGYYIFPGLINSHDHLEFNLFPRLGNPPYRNAYEWGVDLQKNWQHEIQPIMQVPLRYRLLWGAWKNLLSGVTHVVHHNDYFFQFRYRFPLDVVRDYTYAHSLEYDRNLTRSLARRKPGAPFIIHLAEGVDEQSSTEVQRLHSLGGIDARTVAVHGVGMSTQDIQLLHEQGGSLVWCPSSNTYLFGKTAPIESVHNRIPVALGTDSTLTGSTTLFEELRIAKKFSTLSSQELYKLVIVQPRKIFKLTQSAGLLSEGVRANLFIIEKTMDNPYGCLLESSPAHIGLVFQAGKLMFYDTKLLQKGIASERHFPLEMQGTQKQICDKSFSIMFQRVKPFLNHYEYLTVTHANRKASSSSSLTFVCPSCRSALEKKQATLVCTHESIEFQTNGSQKDFILPSRRTEVDHFLRIYRTVRSNECWGSDDSRYYEELPYRDLTGEHSDIWAIRSRSYDCLREQLSLAQPHQTLRILDLGAGNCWLSLRLARLGHKVIAVDVNDDMLDGLGALKRLNTETTDITPVKAEFNYLPFPEQSFDIIIFNASLHYSLEPYRLLHNTLRFLKNTGILFILDSPIYQNESGGQAMLKEKVESFKREHGIELTDGYAGSFLTIPKLEQLKESYRVEIITPSYNVLWKLRPYLARLKEAREPATFALVKLKKNIES